MAKDDFSVSFGIGLLGGIIGGIVAGVLLAPKSGAETRDDLAEALIEAKEKYTPKIIEAKNNTERAIDIIRCKLEQQFQKINSSIKARRMAKAKIIENGHYELN